MSQVRPIQLILTDIDGTLIGRGGEIQPRVRAALESARAAGVHLAICTGRPLFGRAAEYARAVSPKEPHITQNGAHVGKLDGSSLHDSPLPDGALRTLVAASERTGVALEVYTAARCVVGFNTPIAREHQEVIEIEAEVGNPLELTEPVLRAQWVHTAAERGELEAILGGISGIEYASTGTPDMPGALFTSITRLGTSKRAGAAELAAYYGLSLEDVMMVGDGDNDVEVLEAVGLGVAMKNASPKALSVSRRVVGHVDEGGLAEAIALALETRGLSLEV